MKASRRELLVSGIVGATATVSWKPAILLAGPPGKSEQGQAHEEEVSPAEDLMREHGVLRRILLVYAEGLHRLRTKQDLPPKALANAAQIVRSFVENYHEKLEEDHLFPRFKKANRHVELVDVLLKQHQAGRILTDTVSRLSTSAGMKNDEDRQSLSRSLYLFMRMYHPHAAREDTVLFPALRTVVSHHEYDSLGEEFEKREHELFGADGFEKMVDRIAGIEKMLGIDDLAQFTPPT